MSAGRLPTDSSWCPWIFPTPGCSAVLLINCECWPLRTWFTLLAMCSTWLWPIRKWIPVTWCDMDWRTWLERTTLDVRCLMVPYGALYPPAFALHVSGKDRRSTKCSLLATDSTLVNTGSTPQISRNAQAPLWQKLKKHVASSKFFTQSWPLPICFPDSLSLEVPQWGIILPWLTNFHITIITGVNHFGIFWT